MLLPYMGGGLSCLSPMGGGTRREGMEQSSFVQVLHSRKFWALVIALVAIMAGYGTGNLDAWQAIQALVAALAAYSTGVAIEDAGFKAGANRPATPVYELPASPAPLNTA